MTPLLMRHLQISIHFCKESNNRLIVMITWIYLQILFFVKTDNVIPGMRVKDVSKYHIKKPCVCYVQSEFEVSFNLRL